jgi:hypothetical protein
MNEVQLRVNVQNAVTDYVMGVMRDNDVPAHMIEDALNFALLTVKPYVQAELAQSIHAQYAKASEQDAQEKEE